MRPVPLWRRMRFPQERAGLEKSHWLLDSGGARGGNTIDGKITSYLPWVKNGTVNRPAGQGHLEEAR